MLYEEVACAAARWNDHGNIGLVVGATHPTVLAHTVLTLCSHCAHTVLTLCSHIAHTLACTLFTRFSHCAHTFLTLCSHSFHTFLTLCSHTAHTDGGYWCQVMVHVRSLVPDMWILAPGIGAQGGDLEKTVHAGSLPPAITVPTAITVHSSTAITVCSHSSLSLFAVNTPPPAAITLITF